MRKVLKMTTKKPKKIKIWKYLTTQRMTTKICQFLRISCYKISNKLNVENIRY